MGINAFIVNEEVKGRNEYTRNNCFWNFIVGSNFDGVVLAQPQTGETRESLKFLSGLNNPEILTYRSLGSGRSVRFHGKGVTSVSRRKGTEEAAAKPERSSTAPPLARNSSSETVSKVEI